jgi:hypothetical protein
LINAVIHWTATALQFQQLFTKRINLKPLPLKLLLEFQQFLFQISGRALGDSRSYRQSGHGNDGCAMTEPLANAKRQLPIPRI